MLLMNKSLTKVLTIITVYGWAGRVSGHSGDWRLGLDRVLGPAARAAEAGTGHNTYLH